MSFESGLGRFLEGVSRGIETGERIKGVIDARRLERVQRDAVRQAQDERNRLIERSIFRDAQPDVPASSDAPLAPPAPVVASDPQALPAAAGRGVIRDAPAAPSSRPGPLSRSMSQVSPSAGQFKVAGRTYATMDEARDAAEREVGSLQDFYLTKYAPRVADSYLAAGQPEKARAYSEWVRTSAAQSGLRHLMAGLRAINMGDSKGAVRALTDMLHVPGYGADGRVKDVTFLADDQGKRTGALRVAYVGADGSEFTQDFANVNELGRQAAAEFAPEKSFERLWAQPEGVVIGRSLVDKASGKVMATIPEAPQLKVIPRGDGGADAFMFDPNTGQLGPGQQAYAPARPSPGGVSDDRIAAITAQAESGNRDYARDGSVITSPAGARGRMQVMDGTNADPGFGVRPAANDSLEERARVGRDYILAMRQRYGGDMAKAWGAYVWGPGNLDKALAQHGEDWLARAPEEVSSYVSRNVAALSGQRGDGNASPPGASGGPRPAYSTPGRPARQRMTPQEVAAEGLDPGTVYYRGADGMPQAVGGQRATQQGNGPTRQQIGVARQKLQGLRAIKAQLNRVTEALAAAEKGGWVGPIWGRVPGSGSFDDESAALDKAIAQLAPLIRQLTRVPGEGAMSDYESRLATMALPSRTDNPAATREAVAGLRALIDETARGYNEFLGDGAPAASGPPVRVHSMDQARALPSGTLYLAPDGKVRRR